MKNELSRRQFIQKSLGAGVALAFLKDLPELMMSAPKGMKMGLVTYQWGREWDLPTLISNCEKAGLLGIELRVQHAHKVETNLTAAQRADVKLKVFHSWNNTHRFISAIDAGRRTFSSEGPGVRKAASTWKTSCPRWTNPANGSWPGMESSITSRVREKIPPRWSS